MANVDRSIEMLKPLLDIGAIQQSNLTFSNDGNIIILLDFLDNLQNQLTNVDLYYFSCDYYDEKQYSYFAYKIKKHVRADNISSKILVIKGKPGIGKSTFIKKGMEKLLGIKNDSFKLILDAQYFDEDQTIDFYSKKLLDTIREESERIIGDLWPNDLIKMKENKLREDKVYEYLGFLCKKAQNMLNTSCILCFDNIDLHSERTHINIKSAILATKASFKANLQNVVGKLSYIITKRPNVHVLDEHADFDTIEFPIPDVFKIYVTKFEESVRMSSSDSTDVEINLFLESGEVFCRTVGDLAEYFLRLFKENYFRAWQTSRSLQNRFGEINEFHSSISNHNIRRLLKFIGYTIKSGGLRVLDPGYRTYTDDPARTFEYLTMLIRGSYDFHPGNQHADGECKYSNSILVMNLFDFSQWESDGVAIVKQNYFIYIRILQLIEMRTQQGFDSIEYAEIIRSLSDFFPERTLKIALQKLIYSSVIDDLNCSVGTLFSAHDFIEVPIESSRVASLSKVGITYLKTLIVEMEYIFNIAVSTPLFIDNDDIIAVKLKRDLEIIRSRRNVSAEYNLLKQYCLSNKDAIVYLFIKSCYIAMRDTLDIMKSQDTDNYHKFNSMFRKHGNYANNDILYQPIRRMINTVERIVNRRDIRGDLGNVTNALLRLRLEAEHYFHDFDTFENHK